jgi:hypothetical protein
LFFPVALLLAVILADCKDNSVSPSSSSSGFLSKIVVNDSSYQSFSYANGKLVKYEQFWNNNLISSDSIIYNGKKLPQSVVYISGSTDRLIKYYYDSSENLDSVNIFRKNDSGDYVPEMYLRNFYNSWNQLSKTEQFNERYELILTITYKYDAVGNVIEKSLDDSTGLLKLTTMTYDNKINPWHLLKDWYRYDISISKNNVLSIHNNYYLRSDDTKYTYTYNSDGFPVSAVMEYTSPDSHSTMNERFEYK